MYWNVSVGLKCVFISRIDCSLNLLPLYVTVSRNTLSESEISAVNLYCIVFVFVFVNLLVR